MKLYQKLLALPLVFIAGLFGVLAFFIVAGFRIGYTHYKL